MVNIGSVILCCFEAYKLDTVKNYTRGSYELKLKRGFLVAVSDGMRVQNPLA